MRINLKFSTFLSIFSLVIFSFPSFYYGRINGKTSFSPNPFDLINEVNNLRASNGLPPYSIDQRLMSIAQSHTDYQASIGTVTHYGPDGSRPFQRALAAGYPVAGDLSLGGFFSENIISGKNLTVSGAVISWQGDSPHLNTMLSSTSQDIGAGVTIVDETVYYTIDVGLASDSPISNPIEGSQESPYINPININQIITSTPNSDGSIIHVVSLGETLWGISQVYAVPVEEVLRLNNLTNDYIFVGDELLIKEKNTETPTFVASSTQIITPSPSLTSTPTKSLTATPSNLTPEFRDNSERDGSNNLIFIIPALILIFIVIFSIFKFQVSKKLLGK
jgi:LysM repeat protein